MKRKLLYAGFGLLVFLLALVFGMPAQRAVDTFAEPLAANGITLVGVSGTLHSGRAAQLGWRGRDLGTLRWRLHPSGLLGGALALAIELENAEGYLHGDLRIASDGALSGEGIEGRLPAGPLVELMETLPVAIDGQFALHLEQLELDANGTLLAADGVIGWHQAALASPQRFDLGDLQLRLASDAEGVLGHFADGGGPLRIEGELRLTPTRAYTLDAGLTTRAGATPALTNYLGMLGRADAEGLHRLNRSGSY